MAVRSAPASVGDPLLVPFPRRGLVGMAFGLIFWISPVVDFATDATGTTLIAGLVLAAGFTAVYVRVMLGTWRATRANLLAGAQDWVGVGLLVALAAALTVLGHADWTGAWCFVAAATGLRIDRGKAYPMLFVVAAIAAAAEALDSHDAGGAVALFLVALGVGTLTAGFRRLRLVNQELGAARDEIARLAVSDERLRFARDLHDLLGHSLSVVALKSELASRVIADDPDQAAEHLHDIEAVSRRALAEVREAVAGYRRPVLVEELAGARSTLLAAGIDVEADPVPAGPDLPPDAEAVLAWAVREGATNVLRHAGASRVRIRLRVDDRDAALELLDDGCGDGLDAVGSPGGTGLAGLAERVARVRGRMDAAPVGDHGGFRLTVTVPLEAVA